MTHPPRCPHCGAVLDYRRALKVNGRGDFVCGDGGCWVRLVEEAKEQIARRQATTLKERQVNAT